MTKMASPTALPITRRSRISCRVQSLIKMATPARCAAVTVLMLLILSLTLRFAIREVTIGGLEVRPFGNKVMYCKDNLRSASRLSVIESLRGGLKDLRAYTRSAGEMLVDAAGDRSGIGYGYGSGTGGGYGFGIGQGSGNGGSGYGFGQGYGSGNGGGYGFGIGQGSGSGDGQGVGFGSGSGDGQGIGVGFGSGSSDAPEPDVQHSGRESNVLRVPPSN